MKTKVYLCGPITGCSYDDARYGWRAEINGHVDHDTVELLSPMRQQGYLSEITEPLGSIAMEQSKHVMSKSRAIVAKDLWDVRECQLVVANLLGAERVSIGSVFEMGWAQVLHKPIILIIEKDAKLNPHHHMFFYQSANFFVETV